MKKRFSINKFIIAGFCACLAYVAACCIVCGGYHKKQLLQAGRVFGFSEQYLQQEGEGIHYNSERQCMQITEDKAVIVLDEMKAAKSWNYLFVRLGACSADSVSARIDCYNKGGAAFHTSEAQFQAGDNYVTLSGAQASKWIAVQLQDAKGAELSVEKIQLRTKLPVSMKKIAWITVLLAGVLYFGAVRLLSSSGIKSFWNACNIYLFQNAKEILEYIYMELGKHLYLKVKDTWWYRNRNPMRFFLFTLLFFLQFFAVMTGIYARAEYYRYCVLVFCVIIFIMAVLMIEDGAPGAGEERERSWLWTAFWLGTCISDILVDKYYMYTGCVMLFIAGFFFYWWKRMEHPQLLMKNMADGLWAALFLMLLSVFLLYRDGGQNFTEGAFAVTRSFHDQGVIWSGYLRKLNCFGHRERMLSFWGQKWYPANGILEIVYRYGIFAGVFYIGLLLQSGKMLIAQCKNLQENTKYRIFSIGVMAVFLIANLFVSLEAPFLSPVWVIFYLLLGAGIKKR